MLRADLGAEKGEEGGGEREGQQDEVLTGEGWKGKGGDGGHDDDGPFELAVGEEGMTNRGWMSNPPRSSVYATRASVCPEMEGKRWRGAGPSCPCLSSLLAPGTLSRLRLSNLSLCSCIASLCCVY